MATKTSSIILVMICTVFITTAQLTYKFGLNNSNNTIKFALILLGLCMYGMSAILLVIALKGGELSVLYPILALSYVLVALGAKFLFSETLNSWKWFGIVLILLGVYFMGRGSSK